MVSIFPGNDISITVCCLVNGRNGRQETYLNFRDSWHEMVAQSAERVFKSLVSERSLVRVKVEESKSNGQHFVVNVAFSSSDLEGAFRAYSSWKEDLRVQLPFGVSFPDERLQKTTESWEIVAESVDQYYEQLDEQR